MTVNVIHIVRQYYPSVGGMEEVVRNIAKAQLNHPAHQPRILTLNRLFRHGSGVVLDREEEIEGVRVTRLPFSGSTRYPLCPRVLREITEADVLHVHGVDFFYDFLAVTKVYHRRPLILSTHGGFFHTEFASRLKDAWFRTITRASALAYDRVIATSENDGQIFSRIASPRRLSVIENGVDTEKYAECSSPDLSYTLIYFGRWSANKGLHEAIDFVHRLSRQDSRWRLIIAGREYDYSVDDLAEHLARLKLTDVVRLEPNPTNEALRALIGEASYFLCLSRHEGFGLAAIEALSAGLTPILSDIPPFRRLIQNAKLGLLLNGTDSSASIASLLGMHSQGQDAASARRNVAMAFAQLYSWPKVASQYLEAYEQLGKKP